jgi:hypothetical protein
MPLWFRRSLLALAIVCFLIQALTGAPYQLVDLGLALGFASTWR